MTISSQSRKAGPFTGNGSTTAFPFAFKVFLASDVYVVRANTSGVESVLTSGTDYSVTLNSNQNSNPGGTVTLTSALASDFKLVITSAVPNLQPVDITNNGGFYPKVINDALDRVTIMAQQIAQEASRGIKLPITSSLTSDEFTDQLFDARDEAVASASSAGTSATNAANSATSAAGSATTATTKASEASTSASGAASSATAAAGSATAAAGSATTAGNSATTATNKANEAASSATAAAASATAAAGSATTATNKAGEATTAAAAAAGSQSAAAASASAAGTSATNASNSATSASNSATSATSSASSASTSASQAATSATNAASSATAAAGSATTANSAASTATTASAAAVSAANTATTQATNASGSASAAASSASAAASSAASAAAALDSFDDRYLGAKSSAPTVDNDGNALVQGALYYNDGTVSADNKGMWVYDGSQWIKASAAQQASLVTFEYVATAGQTTFSGADANGVTLSYIVGGVMVALNGSRLRPGDDFTASNGTSIVLLVAASAGDELIVDAFRTFDVANTYTQAQVDAFAVKLSGDQTIGGTKTFSNDSYFNSVRVGRGAGAVSTNTAVGASALAANTSGARNVAVGISSLNANTTGGQNSALGDYSMLLNTTGSYNSAVGDYALEKNTTGSYNTALGGSALGNNTTASYNTAVGYAALSSNTTGTENTAIGRVAGFSNSVGSYNAFIGHDSGYNTTSSYNTFVGHLAGFFVTSGAKNTILGRYNGNQGGLDIRTASNYIVLSDGDGNPREYWSNASDGAAFNPAGAYRSARNITVSALNTAYGIYGYAFSGLLVIRDNTSGGTDIWLCDPNQGFSKISGNIPVALSIGWNGSVTTLTQTSGGVSRNFSYCGMGG